MPTLSRGLYEVVITDVFEEQFSDLGYLIRLADKLNIDLLVAATIKIQVDAVKYPVDKARGNSKSIQSSDRTSLALIDDMVRDQIVKELCPICKSTNFKDVVVPRGQGYYRTAFFECCGCSVMFHEPAKFSVDRDEIAKRELAEKKQIQK